MSKQNQIKPVDYIRSVKLELRGLLQDRVDLEKEMDEAHTISLDRHKRMNELSIKIKQKRSRIENYGKGGGVDTIHVPAGNKMSY